LLQVHVLAPAQAEREETVVRRAALEEVGRWAEWCITEDTELGLRLFEAGYTAHYTPVSMGRGLMPDTYDAYKGQRYRWVYGAMQIMKRHAKEIFLGKSKLTVAQRYHFVAGWLPWFADGFALVTPSARRRALLMCCATDPAVANISSTWPPVSTSRSSFKGGSRQ